MGAAEPGVGPLAALARIRRPLPPAAEVGERCELCDVAIAEEHSHVVDLQQRNLRCACRPCALLFTNPGAGSGRYRSVPDRWLALSDFELSAAQWDALQVPVGVAFFFENSDLEEISAFYPSPAGATESLLPLDTWGEVAAANPALADLEPDVEALLVRIGRSTRPEAFVVPIDACYELVGRLRRLWRGFDGGTEAHAALDEFFDRARQRAGVAVRQ